MRAALQEGPAAARPLRLPGFLRRLPFRLLVLAAFVVMLAPVATVVVISVFRDEIVSFPPSGLTLSWYVNAWERREFARGFVTSLQVAALATCIGVPLGTAAAYAIVRGGMRGASAMSTLLLAPLAVPAVVAGTALYMFYLRAEFWLDRDIAATLESLVAAHVLLTIPWTVRLVTASLQGLDRAAEEAAANLGARPLTVFRRVTLPAMRSGIIAACLFSFIQSFENLELSLLLVGPGRTTLPVAMLNYLEFRVDPTLAAVATVQILVVAVLMLVTDRFVSIARTV
ncbi:ABC transporter permease [Roseococcus sp.]|uniref:ABC transporter permease n=1 Tax=Roseococcus sp. TaxID=2109646 RepID=UPI003BA9CBC7